MPTCSNCSYPIEADSKVCSYCEAPNPSYVARPVNPIRNALREINQLTITHEGTLDAADVQLDASPQVSSLMKRYKDAYLVANTINGFGSIIKVVGFVAAGGIGFITLLLTSQIRDSTTGGIVFLLGASFACTIGAVLFVLGIIVSAHGQILKATLDGAVNSSPMLDNGHRAVIMSLPPA